MNKTIIEQLWTLNNDYIYYIHKELSIYNTTEPAIYFFHTPHWMELATLELLEKKYPTKSFEKSVHLDTLLIYFNLSDAVIFILFVEWSQMTKNFATVQMNTQNS